MLHPVTLFYAALCALTIASTLFAAPRDRAGAFAGACVLAIACALSNIAWASNGTIWWIRIDAGVMIVLLALLARDRRRSWRIIVASLSVVTMFVHALDEWAGDQSEAMMYAYPAVLNSIFVAQLLGIASNGAWGAWSYGRTRLASLRAGRSGGTSRRLG